MKTDFRSPIKLGKGKQDDIDDDDIHTFCEMICFGYSAEVFKFKWNKGNHIRLENDISFVFALHTYSLDLNP